MTSRKDIWEKEFLMPLNNLYFLDKTLTFDQERNLPLTWDLIKYVKDSYDQWILKFKVGLLSFGECTGLSSVNLIFDAAKFHIYKRHSPSYISSLTILQFFGGGISFAPAFLGHILKRPVSGIWTLSFRTSYQSFFFGNFCSSSWVLRDP